MQVCIFENKHSVLMNNAPCLLCLMNSSAITLYCYIAADGNFPTIDCEYIVEDHHDFEKQVRGCNEMQSKPLREGETVCYDQIVYDDERAELTEYAGLRLRLIESTSPIVVERRNTMLVIEDDDCEFTFIVSECSKCGASKVTTSRLNCLTVLFLATHTIADEIS